MNYLLDTCVLSEFTRRSPEPRVVEWVRSVEEEKLYLSVLSVGEISHGIEKLPPSARKETLTVWFNDDLLERFGNRLIPIDAQMMLLWGGLVARLEKLGSPVPVIDSLIAATALYHHLILITRNEADFEQTGVTVVNPWNKASSTSLALKS